MACACPYLDGLFSDGGVGVGEAVDHVGENLRVHSSFVQIQNELLHLMGMRCKKNKSHFSPL